MIDSFTSEVAIEALRVLFLICLPLVAAMLISGSIVSVFQGATSIQEPAVGYAVRVSTLIAVFYLLYPTIEESLLRLSDLVYR